MLAISPNQALVNMVRSNPAIANNPQMQTYLDVIESGDSKRGEELANNLLKTYGMTREDAIAAAKAYFRIS